MSSKLIKILAISAGSALVAAVLVFFRLDLGEPVQTADISNNIKTSEPTVANTSLPQIWFIDENSA